MRSTLCASTAENEGCGLKEIDVGDSHLTAFNTSRGPFMRSFELLEAGAWPLGCMASPSNSKICDRYERTRKYAVYFSCASYHLSAQR